MAGIGLASIPPLAAADPLSDLKVQIEALQRKVLDLEGAQKATEAEAARKAIEASTKDTRTTSGDAVTGGATKGSFKLPGSDTSVTLGGYLKLDAIYSDRTAGVASQGNQFLSPSLIPIGPTAGDNARGQLTLHARQSRLFVKTATPTGFGDLTTYLEGDFFGADGNETVSNSNSFRMRHAWATLGHLSVGQFWSNFMNEAALPETLDFGGPVGQIFIRQAQVRWTDKVAAGEWSLSFENPESLFGVPGNATLQRADRDRLPDIAARWKTRIGTGTYTAQILARDIRIDSGAPISAADNRWGGAIGLTGVVPTFGSDDLRFDVNAGNAIGRYQQLGFFADGYIDANHRIELAPTVSGYVAYRHYWTPTIRSSLVLSASHASNPSTTAGGLNRSARSEHLNLIWSPVAAVNLGVELINARREVEDGRSGNVNRLQLSGQYGF
jgi:hypothetical protein